MNKPFNFEHGDDLSDLLGGETVAPKTLPQDNQLARIRESAIGHLPAAKAFQVDCRKCGGSGTWRGSYKSGPCFACKGKGKLERKTAPAQLERARERRQEQAQAIRVEAQPQITWLRTKLLKADRLPEGYAKMLGDFREKLEAGRALTDGQMAVITRGMARDAEYAAQAPQRAQERQEQVKGINVANIVECFQRAKEAGLKTFTLRFDDVHFQADKSEAGLIWVSASGYGSAKLGMIKGGVYRPGRDFTAEIGAKIELISADPMAAARAYAQVTRDCSVCGRHLENEVSVDAGIGPICAGRLGYKPGKKFVPVTAADF